MVYKDLFIATTDTVVGIGAKVSTSNLELINKIKKRPSHKKLVIMISDYKQARSFKKWNQQIEEFSKQYWPGAYTLIIDHELALRMPNNKKLLALIDKIGPIYMTSANISGEPVLSFGEAIKRFNIIKKHYNFGEGSNIPSKLIDVKTKKEVERK